jgi:alpha-1,2-mannosyltransferase
MIKNRVSWLAAAAFTAIFIKGMLYCRFFGVVPFDFRSFYLAGAAFFGGGSIYDIHSLQSAADSLKIPGVVLPYLYPPALAFYLSPLTRLEPLAASRVWELLSLAFYVVILTQSVRLAGQSIRDKGSPSLIYLAAFVLFFALPFDYNFILGQVNALVLVFILFAFTLAPGPRRDLLAGILLACAALIKVTPAFLLLFFLINRRWRVLTGFLAGTATLILPALLSAAGRGAWAAFFNFLPAMSYGKTIPALFPASGPANFSIAGFFARLFENTMAVSLCSYAAALGLLALLVSRHLKMRDKSDPAVLLPYFILMVIASPLAYLHHVIYIYPALLVMFCGMADPGEGKSRGMFWLVVFAALTAGVDFPDNYCKIERLPGALLSINLYALLFLFFVSLRLLKQQAAKTGL